MGLLDDATTFHFAKNGTANENEMPTILAIERYKVFWCCAAETGLIANGATLWFEACEI